VQVDGHCVMIADAYPKARRHNLVIARNRELQWPTQLEARHLPLLRHMKVALGSCYLMRSCAVFESNGRWSWGDAMRGCVLRLLGHWRKYLGFMI
jgi:Scavenger mRNA decapping enzyme C-term binding